MDLPKERNIILVYIFTFLTLGIYGIYWIVKTKGEINKLGGDIPTAWLLIIPIAHLYFIYKYCDAFGAKVKKDNNGIMYFILWILIGIVMPAIVQSELNRMAKGSNG